MVIRMIEDKPEFTVPCFDRDATTQSANVCGFLVKQSRKLYQKLKEGPKIMT